MELDYKAEKVTTNIFLGEDGVYRWIFQYSLWKNPIVFFTVAKVLGISVVPVGLLMFFLTLGEGLLEATKVMFLVLGICYGIFAILLVVAYVFLGVLYGGKYYVLFEMDENGIEHIQLKSQYKKAQAIGFLTAALGGAMINPTVAGVGIASATKQSQKTIFKKVRSVKVMKSKNTIFINEMFSKNQVYVEKEDFDFVKEYIFHRISEKG